jgi:hypothetical protein
MQHGALFGLRDGRWQEATSSPGASTPVALDPTMTARNAQSF